MPDEEGCRELGGGEGGGCPPADLAGHEEPGEQHPQQQQIVASPFQAVAAVPSESSLGQPSPPQGSRRGSGTPPTSATPSIPMGALPSSALLSGASSVSVFSPFMQARQWRVDLLSGSRAGTAGWFAGGRGLPALPIWRAAHLVAAPYPARAVQGSSPPTHPRRLCCYPPRSRS